MKKWWIGCSGFHYSGWMEKFYPRLSRNANGLNTIVSFFNTVELNVTFYRFPKPDDVYKILKQPNISFCSISYPGLPDDVIKTSPVIYYRFHGVPQLYLSSYSNRKLKTISNEIKSLRGVKEVYSYINNDIDVHAISNAETLQHMVDAHPVVV